MSEASQMREDVKKYIDEVDDTTVKMIYAMLEVKRETDWWDELPPDAQNDVDSAIQDIDNGNVLSHEKVQQLHPEWFKR
jgi:hypothetical protein